MADRLMPPLYPHHTRPQRSSQPMRHASSSPTYANVTCCGISRWAALQCKRRVFVHRIIFVLTAIPIIITLAVLRNADYVQRDEQGWILNVHGEFEDGADISSTNSSWSIFAQKYANHYAENDTDFLVELRDILSRKWTESVNNTEEFRNDIRAALGSTGSLERFIVTKQNTKAGTAMKFLHSGGSMKISTSFWKSLPSDQLYRSGLYNRCSVVGSGGILTGSRCGHSIDTADFVFRFNLATMKGYTFDVGSKANFTTLNPSVLYTKFNALRKKADRDRFANSLKLFKGSHLWLPAFAFKYKYQILVKAADVARSSKHVQPIYGHPEHYNTAAKLWQDTLNGTHRTTTGFHVISSIFDLCNRIDVYGFWPFKVSLEGAAVPYHYYDGVNATGAHSFSKEFKALVALHDRGILQLHVGSCV